VLGGHPAAVVVVGGDVLDVQVGGLQAAVDDDDRHADLDGPAHRADHGLGVLRGQDDAVHAGADAAVHDADLGQGVALAQRAVPDDAHGLVAQAGGPVGPGPPGAAVA